MIDRRKGVAHANDPSREKHERNDRLRQRHPETLAAVRALRGVRRRFVPARRTRLEFHHHLVAAQGRHLRENRVAVRDVRALGCQLDESCCVDFAQPCGRWPPQRPDSERDNAASARRSMRSVACSGARRREAEVPRVEAVRGLGRAKADRQCRAGASSSDSASTASGRRAPWICTDDASRDLGQLGGVIIHDGHAFVVENNRRSGRCRMCALGALAAPARAPTS